MSLQENHIVRGGHFKEKMGRSTEKSGRMKCDKKTFGLKSKVVIGEFPSDSVLGTPCFHCSEYRFDPWLGK